jgi:type II secretory pathway pseudopilin PulG
VVAIIALLISILLPSLSEARQQGKKAVCLSNLRSIAQGTNGYASEDRIESAIPIHQNQVSTLLTQGGLNSQWAELTVMPMSYGGRTAVTPFQNSNAITQKNGRWAARTRPLNAYLYDLEGSDETKLPLYRCPSDTGYPDNPFIIDAPPDIAGVPCYDNMGNSFRYNFAGIGWFGVGSVSVGPWGHRLSTLENTAKLTSIMEPQFYSMTIQAVGGPVPPELLLRGWHGAVMTSNVGFADGSARPSKAEDITMFDAATLRAMNYVTGGSFTWETFLRRGADWQMDCYPTPGAWIPLYPPSGGQPYPGSPGWKGWPFNGLQMNMQPPE